MCGKSSVFCMRFQNIILFLYKKKTIKDMFTFAQYLGFLLFLTVLTMGFWLMMFLISFVMYWAGGASIELWKEKRAKKRHEQEQSAL